MDFITQVLLGSNEWPSNSIYCPRYFIVNMTLSTSDELLRVFKSEECILKEIFKTIYDERLSYQMPFFSVKDNQSNSKEFKMRGININEITYTMKYECKESVQCKFKYNLKYLGKCKLLIDSIEQQDDYALVICTQNKASHRVVSNIFKCTKDPHFQKRFKINTHS